MFIPSTFILVHLECTIYDLATTDHCPQYQKALESLIDLQSVLPPYKEYFELVVSVY